MISRISLRFITGLMIFFASSCQPDREVERDYPILTTGVTDISMNSVNLQGLIEGDLNDISETGFVWSTSTVLDLNNGEKFIRIGIPDQDRFTHLTDPSLLAGTQYYARAFIRSGELIIFGNMISFTTLTHVTRIPTP